MDLCVVPNIDRKRLFEKEKLDRSSRLRLSPERFQRLDKTLPFFTRFRKCPVNRLYHDSRVNHAVISPSDKRRSKNFRMPVKDPLATIAIVDPPPVSTRSACRPQNHK